ncbi:hypothetical protein BSF38_04292 [Paludisphaera borealis]|uniref:Uncharacterized protein n=2 Tax=Paludisphaera borealis TaxID=1387353 RepID=A0A1U7CUW1_9BACT|nr:hypothetical protein BSF38_04292 [Paludisphaera borealis]
MMQTAASMRSARFGTTALLALAALALIAPTPAQAGCKGHGVARTRDPALAGLDELWDAGALAELAQSGPARSNPADAPVPCSGAFCSGSPAVPSAPLVAPIDGHGLWANWIDRPESRELNSQPLPFDESQLLPSYCGLSVFHPPRSAAPASV